ncbi:MAG: hypothetical protein AB1411_14970 [Nitrospirota bacterium]
MNNLSSIVDGAIALFGLFAGLVTFVWAIKAGEEAGTAGAPAFSENRPVAKKAA